MILNLGLTVYSIIQSIFYFYIVFYDDSHTNLCLVLKTWLTLLKTSFSKQRNKGLLSDEAVTVLRQAVDSVQNDPSSCQERFQKCNL